MRLLSYKNDVLFWASKYDRASMALDEVIINTIWNWFSLKVYCRENYVPPGFKIEKKTESKS